MAETLRHALCALILTLTVAAGSAYAHSPLTSSNPSDGAVVAGAPEASGAPATTAPSDGLEDVSGECAYADPAATVSVRIRAQSACRNVSAMLHLRCDQWHALPSAFSRQ